MNGDYVALGEEGGISHMTVLSVRETLGFNIWKLVQNISIGGLQVDIVQVPSV